MSIPLFSTQSATICLRCQYRLLKRVGEFRPFPACRPKVLKGSRKATTDAVTGDSQRDGLDGTAYGLPESSQDPRNRRYTGYRRLGAESAKLGVDTLGRPAEVMILRDWQLAKRENKHLPEDSLEAQKNNDNASPSEFLDSLLKSSHDFEANDAVSNIEYFKLSWDKDRRASGNSRSPTEAEYNKMARALFNCFTLSQLRAYADQKEGHSVQKLYKNLSTDLYTRSPWVTGTTPFPKEALTRVNSVKRGDSGASTGTLSMGRSTKHALVETILRRVWLLRTREEEASKGELDMLIQEEQLDFLLKHNSGIFEKVAERYHAKVDISRSNHIVRFSSDRAACTELFKFVVFMLEKISYQEINLSSHLPPTMDREFDGKNETIRVDSALLEQIERLTNTLIKPVQPADQKHGRCDTFRVYYLSPNESDADDAHRLLMQSIQRAAQEDVQLSWDFEGTNFTALPCPVDARSGLPWFEREKQWSRWQTPISKDRNASSSSVLQRLASDHNQHVENSVKGRISSFLLQSNIRRNQATSLVSQALLQAETHLSAIFGQVIFPSKVARDLSDFARSHLHGNSKIRGSARNFLECPVFGCDHRDRPSNIERHLQLYHGPRQLYMDSGRTFSTPKTEGRILRRGTDEFKERLEPGWGFMPTIPGLLSLLQSRDSATTKQSYQIRVRLTPLNQSHSTKNSTAFPDLQLRLEGIENHETMHLAQATWIINKKTSDLLLPQYRSDLRFLTETQIDAPIEKYPSLQQFVRDSELNIWGRNRLRTPTRLALWVPQGLSEIGPSISQGLPFEYTEDQILVDYAFAGLEVRSKMLFRYEDMSLSYTDIEAGQTGGRRTELQLWHQDFDRLFEVSRNLIRELDSPDADMTLSPAQLARATMSQG